MVGDASGIVDPLTGNGMAMAIQSAALAAPFIVQLLAANDDRDRIEESYRVAHRRFFDSRIRWSRRVAAFLSRPTLLDAALVAVRTPRMGHFLLGHTRASVEAASRLADEWF
jgi:flavin-dependent dehydrogenase